MPRIAPRQAVIRAAPVTTAPDRLSKVRALHQVPGNQAMGRLLEAHATHDTLSSRGVELARSWGQPLDSSIRAIFGPRLGLNLTGVRVHTGPEAAESALRYDARAYTVGSDIVFGAGMYHPATVRGQCLLAHELVHVAQQRLGNPPLHGVSTEDDRSEREARRATAAMGWGRMHHRYSDVAGVSVQHAGSQRAPNTPALTAATARLQRVQLTYDDGPDTAGNTQAVLTALNAAGARATFYLVGKRVAQGTNWKIVFDIAAAGHWLGNHAYDWNDATDNHIFLSGSTQVRAERILQTEWVIRDALIQGRDDAIKNKTWTTIPQANRDYIDDVIAHGTGRFRTPGFRSKWWDPDGSRTLAAIASANSVLAATGLRPLKVTEVSSWGLTREGVSVDPEDWRSGRTQSEIETKVQGGATSNVDSILLHSRIAATAGATPAILADLKGKKFTWDPTVQGTRGAVRPRAGFADLSTISTPPTSTEIAHARAWLKKHMLTFGPYISGSVAIGIFQLAQEAGSAEAMAFAAEIKATTVKTPMGDVPMANWMMVNPDWAAFTTFFENWTLKKPFPRIKGVTI